MARDPLTPLDKWEKPMFWVGLGLGAVGLSCFAYWAYVLGRMVAQSWGAPAN